MLGINDVKPGMYILYNEAPQEVLSADHLMLGRGGGMLQVRLKNIKSGAVTTNTFKGGDVFEEAEVSYKKMNFVYHHRDTFVFTASENPRNRFELGEDTIEEAQNYLTPGLSLDGLSYEDRILNIKLPPKVDLKVIEAPPAEKGNTAQGGRKPVRTETGLTVQAPFFIETGDTIRVNTKTGEYVERVQ